MLFLWLSPTHPSRLILNGTSSVRAKSISDLQCMAQSMLWVNVGEKEKRARGGKEGNKEEWKETVWLKGFLRRGRVPVKAMV